MMRVIVATVLWLNLALTLAVGAGLAFIYFRPDYLAKAVEFGMNRSLAAAGIKIDSVQSLIASYDSLRVGSFRASFKSGETSVVVKDLELPLVALTGSAETLPRPLEFKVEISSAKLPQSVKLGDIAVTLFVEGERLQVSLGAPELAVGGVSFKEVAVDAEIFIEPKKALVKIGNIDLARVFKLYPSSGVSGSGIVDINAPVEYGAQGFTVKDGQFAARGSGRLSIPLGELIDHPQYRAAAAALNDFSYDLLSGTLSISPQGDLELRIRLEGRGLDSNNGQPVNVNAKVEENLPMLFRSIGAVQNVTGYK